LALQCATPWVQSDAHDTRVRGVRAYAATSRFVLDSDVPIVLAASTASGKPEPLALWADPALRAGVVKGAASGEGPVAQSKGVGTWRWRAAEVGL